MAAPSIAPLVSCLDSWATLLIKPTHVHGASINIYYPGIQTTTHRPQYLHRIILSAATALPRMLDPLGAGPVDSAAFTAVAHHRGASFRPKVATPAGCPTMSTAGAEVPAATVPAQISSVAQPLYTFADCTPATDSCSPFSPWWKGKMQGSLAAGGEMAVQEMALSRLLVARVSRVLTLARARLMAVIRA